MKRILSTALLLLTSYVTLDAQSREVSTFSTKKTSKNIILPENRPNLNLRHGLSNGSRSTTVCDTMDLDYGGYDYYYGQNKGLTSNGSWQDPNLTGVSVIQITNHVDTMHKYDLVNATITFDSIPYASGTAIPYTLGYIPMGIATIKMDSMYLGYGLHGDSTTFNTSDSLIFTISVKSAGTTTYNVVSTSSIVGSALNPYNTTSSFRLKKFPISYQFAKGDRFKVMCAFSSPDTSHHFYLTYSNNDSCGTIPYNGHQVPSPAYPSSMIGKDNYTEIRVSGGVASTSPFSNTFGYNIPGVPANCSFVYEQNIDIIPIVSVCTDFAADIVATPASGCPGATINLSAQVYGVSQADAANLTFAWSSKNGTISPLTGSTTTDVLGANSDTVYLAVNNAGVMTYDTFKISNKGVVASFTSPSLNIGCSQSATLSPVLAGVTTGKTYAWSTGAHTATITTNSAGTYTVTVMNGNGCSAVATETVNFTGVANNAVSFTAPTPTGHTYLCKDVTYNFINTSARKTGWNATWTMDGTIGSGGNNTDASYAYPATGSDTVVLTMDSAGCVFTSAKKVVTVKVCIGINDVAFENGISISPNPTTGNVNFDFAMEGNEASIKVYNVLGAEVKSISETGANTFSKSYNFGDLTTGTYLVKIQTGKNIATKRLVISKN